MNLSAVQIIAIVLVIFAGYWLIRTGAGLLSGVCSWASKHAAYITLALCGVVLLYVCGVFDILGDTAGSLEQIKAGLGQ